MHRRSVLNIGYCRREYGVVHFAEDNLMYSSVACGTPNANVASDNTNEVSCLRCLKTDAFRHAKNDVDKEYYRFRYASNIEI